VINTIPTVAGTRFAMVAGSNACTAGLSLNAGASCQLKVRHTQAGGTGTLSTQTNATNNAGVINDNLVGNN